MGKIADKILAAQNELQDARLAVTDLEVEHAAMERILSAQGRAPQPHHQDPAYRPQLTLGEFIAALEKASPEAEVLHDFCSQRPGSFGSYRGYYEQLALAFSENSGLVKAKDLLESARACIGRHFTGWKGGDYVMDADTPLWVANAGHTGWAIVGVRVESEGEWAYIEAARVG